MIVSADELNNCDCAKLPSYSVVPHLLRKDGITPVTNLVESFYAYRQSPQYADHDFKYLTYCLVEQFISSEGTKTAALWHTHEFDLGLMIQLDKIKVCPPKLIDKSLLAPNVAAADIVEQFPLFTVFYMLLDETEKVTAMCAEQLPSVSKVPTFLKNIMAGFRYFKSNEERDRNFLNNATDAENDKGYDDFRNLSYIVPFAGEDRSSLCCNSGCDSPGTMKCSQCKVALYCSKAHQAEHWKMGGHKQDCGADTTVVVPLSSACGTDTSEGNKKFVVKMQMKMTTGEEGNFGAVLVLSDRNNNILATVGSSDASTRSEYFRLYNLFNSHSFEYVTVAATPDNKSAFVYARREDNSLHIFVNQFLRTPYAW